MTQDDRKVLAAAMEYADEQGGGGGGTTNYNSLENKPKINSVELSGNKSLTDLGIASSESLNDKVDKVTGKGLSTNDYDDTAKAVVDSTTASLNSKVDKTSVGSASGVAELDEHGKVPSAQLPSFVDDVVEGYYDSTTDRFYEESTFETVITPESGKSWVDVPHNKSYRWTGTVYVRVDEGVQIGETSDTAYRGDRGKTAYDHSQVTGNPHGTTKADVGLGNVDNTSDANKPVSTATQTALNSKQNKTLDTPITVEGVEQTTVEGALSAINNKSGGTGGGHTIIDPDDTSMTQRAGLKFGGDFEVSDNSTDDETEITPHELTSAEMAEIMSTLPGTPTKGIKYSTTEQVIGQWIDGKPLYQKTFTGTVVTSGYPFDLRSLNIDSLVSLEGMMNYNVPINYSNGTYYLHVEREMSNDVDRIKCSATSGWNNLPLVITIQYTKTTD